MGRYIYDSVNQQEIPVYDSGGHTIKDSSGTSMTKRTNLKFMNATVTDDSTNDVTIVTPEGGDSGIMIAGTEESSTASQAYLPEQYLIYEDALYKVIASITQGDTLEEDENIEAVTLGGELANHLSVNGTGFYFDSHDGVFGFNTSPSRSINTFIPFGGGTDFMVITTKTGDTAQLLKSNPYTFTESWKSVLFILGGWIGADEFSKMTITPNRSMSLLCSSRYVRPSDGNVGGVMVVRIDDVHQGDVLSATSYFLDYRIAYAIIGIS